MIDNLIRLPIVILSSPRTGSGALAYALSQKHKLRLFVEPDVTYDSLKEFIDYDDINYSYVLKCHTAYLDIYPIRIQDMVQRNECHTIRIRRRSLVDQIASNYVALASGVWNYLEPQPKIRDAIELYPESIMLSIEAITRLNRHSDELTCKINTDLYYEDIKDQFEIGHDAITPKPENYEDLKEAIQKLL